MKFMENKLFVVKFGLFYFYFFSSSFRFDQLCIWGFSKLQRFKECYFEGIFVYYDGEWVYVEVEGGEEGEEEGEGEYYNV